jgi:hypothetical protein
VSTSTPERSPDQRMDALDKANAVRVQRSHLKRDLKAGRVSIDTLILRPPAFLLTARIADFLLATPKWGRVKVTAAMKHCGAASSKTFAGLTDRQRMEMVRTIREVNAASEERRDRSARQAASVLRAAA